MTWLRILLIACALSVVAGCGDDDYQSDGSTNSNQDLSATVNDLTPATHD